MQITPNFPNFQVLVLVLKIPNFQVLVLVLKYWFCRYWYWYWPQKAFPSRAAADVQKRYKNSNCNNQTIQKWWNRPYLPLHGWFKAALRMPCSKIYSQYWIIGTWYWSIGILASIGIGFGIENTRFPGIGIGIDFGPVRGIGLAKLVLSVSGKHLFYLVLSSWRGNFRGDS